MRHFVIDQLSREDRQAIAGYLEINAEAGPINDLFWLALPGELHTPAQQDHQQCGPFYLAIELGEESVSFELLVRSQTTLHCSCIAYADKKQREFLLDYIDTMTAQLQLRA